MTQFNPATPVIAVANFTLAGAPGKVKAGSIVWSSDNAIDTFTQVDADDGSSSTATWNGSAEADGAVSHFTCTANGNTGGGAPSLVSATSDPAEWTVAAAITADGETIGMSQAAPSTPAQAAVHRAGLAKR